MRDSMDFNVQAESARGAIAIGGATVSVVTLNEVIAVLTVLYLLVVLFNATPKLLYTVKHLRQAWKNRGGKRVD